MSEVLKNLHAPLLLTRLRLVEDDTAALRQIHDRHFRSHPIFLIRLRFGAGGF